MTASAAFNYSSILETKAIEDAKTISAAADVLKQDFVSCVGVEKEVSENIEKVLNMTNMSIKMYSTSYYKKSASLDTLELEQIKTALENFKNDCEKVQEFKNELISDLTVFQKQIRTNHIQRLAAVAKEKQQYEKELLMLNVEKNKLIMDRLSKIVWPYDEKTKEYDSKIAVTEARIQQYAKRIQDLQTTRPCANAKDILVYQMQLKEKYAQK